MRKQRKICGGVKIIKVVLWKKDRGKKNDWGKITDLSKVYRRKKGEEKLEARGEENKKRTFLRE